MTGLSQQLFGTLPTMISSVTDSNYWRAATGVKGNFSAGIEDWDWNLGYTHSMSTVSNSISGLINPTNLTTALQNGTLDFVNPSATPNAVNSILTSANNLAISKLDALDATLSTPSLFHIPTGEVGLGLGAQFLHESELIEEGPA
jgi:iron complex outermembrane recepter protein